MPHLELETPTTTFRDVVIIGGGCYGTFYATQLAAASARGNATYRRVILVDRNPDCQFSRELPPDPSRQLVVGEWGAYLAEFLSRPAPSVDESDDAIVPSPLMPHLMAEWLLQRARQQWRGRTIAFAPPSDPVGTPYDMLGRDGTRYVSFADWICPTHCVEPLTCPVIRGPRTWEMSDALERYRARLNQTRPTLGPALFVTRHRAFGVGMFDLAEARSAERLLADAGATGVACDMLVATISSCHGAVSLIRFE